MSSSTTPKKQMTDIHMHLIPGVDDGAENMEMALAMMSRHGSENCAKGRDGN